MAKTIAVVNMKGGVGKSTLTFNLGAYCAYRRNKRVLLIDLDPQFNLSQYALGSDGYEKHLDSGKKTVFDVFEQFTPSVSAQPRAAISPADVIASVRHLRTGGVLDIMPSRLELAWTLKNPHEKEHLLRQTLASIRGSYDLILIDCPPTESMLTTAAYLASDSVLVPVKPEFLSTIGLPLLVRSLDEFRTRHQGTQLDLVGIVFNSSSEKLEHSRSREFVGKIAKQEGWYVFQSELTPSDSYSKGSRLGRPIFMTDNARSWKIEEFEEVAKEFMGRVSL